MARSEREQSPFSNFVGGIADFEKDGAPATYAFGRSVDYRSNPRELTLLPKTTKESGSLITALPKWGERVSNTTYIYDASGNIYSRSSLGSYAQMRTVGSSHGNGMVYFGEDDFLYYAGDKVIGRYGPVINGTPTFIDDFFGSQGGVPTNTQSVSFASASSMYDDRADTASLSVTSNLSLEVYVKHTTLPTVGNSMTYIGKWDESGATRSYKLDINAISGYFGDGSDSTLTIAADTTEAPIDSAATGTSGTTTLSATNISFTQGQVILIHQSQGTGAGTWMRNTINGYTAGTITLESPLNASYVSGAQVRVMKRYTTVTINSGKTYTAKAWNGTVGGILAFLASTGVVGTGTISANSCGFRGGTGIVADHGTAQAGEGTAGVVVAQTSANGNGGGGGRDDVISGASQGGGGGGGNANSGSDGVTGDGSKGLGGSSAGSADLTTMVFGGGGGGGGASGGESAGNGGVGGGIIFLTAVDITISGGVQSNGAAGGTVQYAGGGGGAGGSILLKSQTATLGSGLITATGGAAGVATITGDSGGAGSVGRVHLDYLTSYTGTSSPTLNVTQDNSLVTTTTYQLRLAISNDGTAFENLTKNLTTISTGVWTRLGISWVASTATCTFYQDGVNLGSYVGTKTSISDNASRFYVGANKGASTVGNFFNGKTDDLRVWSSTRTDAQMFNNKDVQLGGSETGLVAYYKFNNAHTDSTANANNLTANNTPTFSTDVPFSNPTTRLDIDQSATTTGNTYTTPLAISEVGTDMKTFVPAKDPQKSIDVLVAAKGTGDWTLTVHDGLNRTVATATITNANMTTGYVEFTFSSVWRPIIGATYHIHLTSTVADGTVTTTTLGDLSTVSFHTYYQFLVSDTDYHPMMRFLNMIVTGNDRYLATYDASTYVPNKLKFPSGYRVRCLAQWREYLAIGCWKGTNIYDYDDGIIFFWDGYSQTYNFYVTVPEGGINAMIASKGVLYVWAGYQGDILEYVGGDSADKLKRIPKMAKDKYIEVMPGAVSMWQANLRVGVAGNSDSSTVERGVYTLGQHNKTYPVSLSYDYPISTGNRTSSNIQIGMILPIDRKLLIGWKDNTSYGVDVVDPSGLPFSAGTVEKLIDDSNQIYQQKQLQVVRADFKTLNTGESVTLKYKLDRASGWTSGSPATSGNYARLTIPIQTHKEFQIAADLATTISTAPTLLSLTADVFMDPDSEDF